jgi:3-oxoacyl-[acyl-carrier protein] reductase
MNMEFSGKVAVITGGASGIGEAATRAFAKAGAKVVFTYISSAKEAKALEAEIKAAGGDALAIKADLTKKSDADAAFDAAVKAFGTVDIVFTNAGGILQRVKNIDATEDLWQRVLALNVTSTFLTCQAAIRIMEPKKSGVIVTMSSLAAMSGGGPGASHYAASKGAIVTYTRGLAKELGPSGIRVNGVAPGLIATRFHEQFNTPEGRKAAVAQTPLGREGTAEDVANLVLFLSSDRASFITGETVQINGGTGMY